MNLKYYLRGLGLGIVITAVLMGIATGGRKETLTDDEIITKAKALGMMEDSVLAEYVAKAESDTEAKLRPQIEEELRISLRKEIQAELDAESALQQQGENGGIEGSGEEAGGAAGTAENGSTGEQQLQEPEVETEPKPEPVEFTVYSGELPKDISSRLESAGLVKSASEFEKFLLGNGYDRSIVAAKYRIPVGADAEQIARIITGHRDAAE